MKLKSLIAIAVTGICFSVPAAAETVVSLPRFEGISLQGGGRVILRHGSQQKVTIVQGDSDITRLSVDRQSLKIDACEDRCPAGYRLVLEVVSPDIEAIAVRGGGTVEAEGRFPGRKALALSVQGGGAIDTEVVDTQRVAASVQGGGTIRTKASSSLAASVNGGGTITYLGDPSIATSIRGGGHVDRARTTSSWLRLDARETVASRCLPIDAIRV